MTPRNDDSSETDHIQWARSLGEEVFDGQNLLTMSSMEASGISHDVYDRISSAFRSVGVAPVRSSRLISAMVGAMQVKFVSADHDCSFGFIQVIASLSDMTQGDRKPIHPDYWGRAYKSYIDAGRLLASHVDRSTPNDSTLSYIPRIGGCMVSGIMDNDLAAKALLVSKDLDSVPHDDVRYGAVPSVIANATIDTSLSDTMSFIDVDGMARSIIHSERGLQRVSDLASIGIRPGVRIDDDAAVMINDPNVPDDWVLDIISR